MKIKTQAQRAMLLASIAAFSEDTGFDDELREAVAKAIPEEDRKRAFEIIQGLEGIEDDETKAVVADLCIALFKDVLFFEDNPEAIVG